MKLRLFFSFMALLVWGADSFGYNHTVNPALGYGGHQIAPGGGYGGNYQALVNACLQGRDIGNAAIVPQQALPQFTGGGVVNPAGRPATGSGPD